MNLILEIFKGYGVEYDASIKAIIINKPISVATFMDLRRALKWTNSDIKDIRVYGDNYSRVRGRI